MAADGSLLLARAGGDDLVVHDPDPADRRLLELLATGVHGGRGLAAELALAPSLVAAKLAALLAADAITAAPLSPPLGELDAERFSRQLPYLAELGDEHELQRSLARARVVVVGCGGLGTWTVAALASAGVRRFTLVDDDAVELSNLNRQILFGEADVGTPKVAASAAWLRAFDARIEADAQRRRVDGPDAARAVVEGADALVLAADTPPYLLGRWINAACVERRVPFISAGQLPPLLRVGPLYVPGETACFACHERQLRRESAAYDDYVRQQQSAPPRGATLGPASGIVGTLLALDLMHALLGVAPASAGCALVVDMRTLALRREPVARDSACPVCQHLS